MKTSSELRAEARAALKRSDAYWLYVAGGFLLGLVGSAVMIPAVLMLASAGPIAKALGVKVPDTFAGLLTSPLMVVAIALAAVLVCLFIYLIGFLIWGKFAMALAASRGGLRIGHAFSGWGNGWRMGWIFLVQTTFAQLWCLLLVVPGIYKMFAYAMTPYIAIDHPDWDACRCITESRRLMRGCKCRYFLLNLSFIGWYLLVVLVSMVPVVGGIAAYFLEPYVGTACARFYEHLLDMDESSVAAGSYVNPDVSPSAEVQPVR